MDAHHQFKLLASLIGEPARASMLWALLDGKAFTATELAIRADVSAQSASMHLSKLVKANLLMVESQGRHRYYRFSKHEVAYAIEAMANLLPAQPIQSMRSNDLSSGVKYCRSCYDHLAGKVGVALTDQLVKQNIMRIQQKQYDVTPKGIRWFNDLGVHVDSLKLERRVLARQCLDWSERRHHLAGALGATFLERLLAMGWLRRVSDSRTLNVTAKGQQKFYESLQLSV